MTRSDEHAIAVMSHYRSAELHGAALLMRLVRLMAEDGDAQVKLTRHIADEARHAWLWTQRIHELGGTPVPVGADYQTRIGRRTLPRTLADVLALTIVAEERSMARYGEHARRPDVDEATRRVLDVVCADEPWHLAWLRSKLEAVVGDDPAARASAVETMDRYRRIDDAVYAELAALERAATVDAPGRSA